MRRVWENLDQLLAGLSITLELFVWVLALGFLIGMPLGVVSARWRSTAGTMLRVVSFLMSSTPALVLLFWLHYPLQQMLNVTVDPFATATLTLATINSFGIATILSNAIASLPRAYVEAADVCGLTPWQSLRSIEVPLVLRIALPSFLVLQINVLHGTLFASLIGVEELFRVVQRVNARVLQPIPLYTSLALFFIALCLPVNLTAFWIKRRLSKEMSDLA